MAACTGVSQRDRARLPGSSPERIRHELAFGKHCSRLLTHRCVGPPSPRRCGPSAKAVPSAPTVTTLGV